MKRRSLLGGILAAMVAPAIVRASSLMVIPKIWVPDSFSEILVSEVPSFYNGDFTVEGWFKDTLTELKLTKGSDRYSINIATNKWSHLAVTNKGLYVNGSFQEKGPISEAQNNAVKYLTSNLK